MRVFLPPRQSTVSGLQLAGCGGSDMAPALPQRGGRSAT